MSNSEGSDSLKATSFGIDIDELLESGDRDLDALLSERDELDIEALLHDGSLDLDELLEQAAANQLDVPTGEWWP